MKFVKSLMVVISWIIALVLVANYAHVVVCISFFLLLAAPYHKTILGEDDDDVLPSSTLEKFSALTNMTCLGIIKAGIITNKIRKKQDGRVLNLSDEGK